ncbi:MAG: glycosyltransferase [Fervidicoccaceae archaeon]
MKKVVVAQHLYGFIGGGEILATQFIKAFRKMGYSIAIASTAEINRDKAEKWFNVDLSDVRTYALFPFFFPYLGLYQRYFFPYAINKAIEREKPDLVYIDTLLYKPVLKKKEKMGFKIMNYIHFPDPYYIEDGLRRAFDPVAAQSFKEEQKEYLSKYNSGWWSFYYRAWARISKRIMVEDPFSSAEYVLTNSKYTARAIYALYGKQPTVLYPPVEVEIFERKRKPYSEREKAAVMIGRITREKGHKAVIEAIAKTKSKPKLRIVGGLAPADSAYKDEIEAFARERGVEVEFHINVPREEVAEIAGSSLLFIHNTSGEHFGIAVVEAMASGLPVIVRKSAGPYLDIIDEGRYGLYFEGIEDLASKIDAIAESESEWKKYSELSERRAEDFTEDKFFENLSRIMRE